MKNSIICIAAFILLSATGCKQTKQNQKDSILFSKGEVINNDNFEGTAWLKMLASPDSLNTMYAGYVTFEPGARTNWHSHPAGQILIAINGEGFYQEEGKAKRRLRKGETVKCLPNVTHWHGASSDSEFSHIAISSRDKGAAQWLQPVSDKEYNSPLK